MAKGHATRTTLAKGHATRTTLAKGHATRTTFNLLTYPTSPLTSTSNSSTCLSVSTL
ncbi:hypothetical protein [Moorena sp. SIO3A2]|uniref:hypothetical protein n=1 Tax=Moorena sp. SIO3A2 TaxID=2607841 RepID=UPI0013B88C4D|nr:hypothetical protein [Moorena sp. SIO3A2]NEQ16938.1 hypothetical protein [Moorena sp. SIO3E2]NER91801.1 hypothetical protein [Moorena sp. SIO3A2]NES41280.1 hypothetical protein [Moorena sp. SIO2C4]